MADRDAVVKLNLRAGGFVGGIRDAGREVQRVGQAMGKAVGQPLKAGFNAARNAAGTLTNEIKGAIKATLTLGGALGGGALVKSALDLQSVYSLVSFQIQNSTGELVEFDRIQRAVAEGAEKTSRTHQELATALQTMMDRGATPDFALASLESVGHAINVTGLDAERTGRMMAGLSKMYGLTGKEGAAALDGVMLMAAKSGATVEEIFEDFTEFGSVANAAGIHGKAGFELMMGVLSKVGPVLNGTTSEMSSGLEIFFERLRDVGRLEQTLKSGGGKLDKEEFIKLDGAIEQAQYLMEAGPKVMAAFQEEFTGREEKAAFDSFFGPYFATLNEELASGKTEMEANAAAIEATKTELGDMGKPFKDLEKVINHSAKQQQSAAAKLRAAQNKLVETFSSPEMLDSINSLAKSLPELAEGMAKLVTFAVDNPALAGGMYAGARVGMPAIGAAVGSKATGTMVVKGGRHVGSQIAASFAADVASKGKWGAIGKNVGGAAGIAFAAVAAVMLGEYGIDKLSQKGQEVGQTKFTAGMAAHELQRKIVRQGGEITPEDIRKGKEIEGALTKKETIGGTYLGGAAGKVADVALQGSGIGIAMKMLFQSATRSGAGLGSKESLKSNQETIEFLRALGSAAETATTELQKVGPAARGTHGLPPPPPTGGGA